jgi:hypothetical protein
MALSSALYGVWNMHEHLDPKSFLFPHLNNSVLYLFPISLPSYISGLARLLHSMSLAPFQFSLRRHPAPIPWGMPPISSPKLFKSSTIFWSNFILTLSTKATATLFGLSDGRVLDTTRDVGLTQIWQMSSEEEVALS